MTLYLEDDDGNIVEFRSETVTFTILLTEIYFVKIDLKRFTSKNKFENLLISIQNFIQPNKNKTTRDLRI